MCLVVLPLRAAKLGEEVFIHGAEDFRGAALLARLADGANKVGEFTQTVLVERGQRIVLEHNAPEARVITLNGDHGVVHELADRREPSAGLEASAAGLRRYPKDFSRTVFTRRSMSPFSRWLSPWPGRFLCQSTITD